MLRALKNLYFSFKYEFLNKIFTSIPALCYAHLKTLATSVLTFSTKRGKDRFCLSVHLGCTAHLSLRARDARIVKSPGRAPPTQLCVIFTRSHSKNGEIKFRDYSEAKKC